MPLPFGLSPTGHAHSGVGRGEGGRGGRSEEQGGQRGGLGSRGGVVMMGGARLSMGVGLQIGEIGGVLLTRFILLQ